MSDQAQAMSSDQGDVIAEIARLRAENARLKDKAAKAAVARLNLKVSAKGAASLYGMGKWPVTLYKEQWLKLLDYQQEVRDFIAEHDHELKAKGE